MTTGTIFSASLAAAVLSGCSGDGNTGNLFEQKPECMGEAVTAYAGTQPQVISELSIGAAADGFDLDGDGKPDNKLAAVSSIAKSAIDEAPEIVGPAIEPGRRVQIDAVVSPAETAGEFVHGHHFKNRDAEIF